MIRSNFRLSALMAALSVLIFSAVSFAGPSGNVLSNNIRDADGTSGQNTSSGSGVKTGHIQNSAVTTAKIADGAVTDAKISGTISASKISSTGLNADTVDGMHAIDFAPSTHTHSQSDIIDLSSTLAGKSDVNHNHDGVYQKKYSRVAVVAQSGGDYTSPVAAMNDSANWCVATPCLLKIVPGIYDIGTESVHMQGGIDIEGSGENTTVIQGNIDSYMAGVVIGSSNAEIRLLTVQNVGGNNSSSVAIYNAFSSTQISNITAVSSAIGAAHGIYNFTSSPVISNSRISASGGTQYTAGIFNYGASSPVVSNTDINVTGAGPTFGVSYGVNNYCGGDCKPVLINVNITSGGGSYNVGIWNFNATPSIEKTKIITGGGTGIVASNSTVRVDNSIINGGVNSDSSSTVLIGGSRVTIYYF